MTKMRTFFVDKLDVRVYPTRQEMGKACAMEAARVLRQIISEKGSANIILASAPSQLEMLDSLRAEPGIAWDKIYAFHMDEYIGLPANAPQNFSSYLKYHFFSKPPFDKTSFAQVFFMDGNPPSLQAECERYAALLRQYPVDVSFVGIGENGHLAFNDPAIADFDDPLLVKINPQMDATCRQQQVTDGWFPTLEDVPNQAITITMSGLTAAPYVFACVPGKTKQQIVRQCLEGPISTACPGSVLRRHPASWLYLDSDSAAMLAV